MLLASGRKGQIITLDIFSKEAINYNMFIAASSGAGKSFFVNYLVSNYYAAGAKIRIVDVGKSYQKMTRMHGARFLDFDDSSSICLNPFTSIDEVRLGDMEQKEYLENTMCLIAAVMSMVRGRTPQEIRPLMEESSL